MRERERLKEKEKERNRHIEASFFFLAICLLLHSMNYTALPSDKNYKEKKITLKISIKKIIIDNFFNKKI